jgi:hypothetical protein
MNGATKQPLTLSLSPYEGERGTISLSQLHSNAFDVSSRAAQRLEMTMSSQAKKIQVARMLLNQTKVLLLPFLRGEGRDEGLLFRVRVQGETSPKLLFRASNP